MSPAQMTITARTVPKFCAHIRAALPEIFFLDLISLVISGTIEPWPECQPEESRLTYLEINAPHPARSGSDQKNCVPGKSDKCRRPGHLRGSTARERVTNAEGPYPAPGVNGRLVSQNQLLSYIEIYRAEYEYKSILYKF